MEAQTAPLSTDDTDDQHVTDNDLAPFYIAVSIYPSFNSKHSAKVFFY